MTQGYDRPDTQALEELAELLRNVGEELAAWRRRSLKAEAELGEARARGGVVAGPELVQTRRQMLDAELETNALRERVEGARNKLENLVARLRFLEHDADESAG